MSRHVDSNCTDNSNILAHDIRNHWYLVRSNVLYTPRSASLTWAEPVRPVRLSLLWMLDVCVLVCSQRCATMDNSLLPVSSSIRWQVKGLVALWQGFLFHDLQYVFTNTPCILTGYMCLSVLIHILSQQKKIAFHWCNMYNTIPSM